MHEALAGEKFAIAKLISYFESARARDLEDLLLLPRQLAQAEQLGRVHQPFDVLAQAEDARAFLGRVGANALEDPGAVVQRRREEVDGGLLERNQLAVHPDVARFHRGTSCG